ncbi:MAG: DUF5658 family protein, partial [Verrucomicrobiota bacterium]
GNYISVAMRKLSITRPRISFLYGGILLAGSIDLLLTTIILGLGGQEVNPLANSVLQAHGLVGLVVFKNFMMGLVILGCDLVASHDRRVARKLAVALIAIHAAPLPWSTGLLIQAV